MKKFLLSLFAIAVCTALSYAETITFDFATIGGTSWNNQYSNSGSVSNDDVEISISGCSKQASSISDRPVSKGAGIVIIKLKDASSAFASVKFTCKQWTNKAQTMVLKYSTNGTSFSAFNPAISASFATSTNSETRSVDATEIPEGTVAIQLSFTGTNQIGIDKVEYELAGANAVEKPEITSVLIGATANVTLACATEGATIYYGFAEDEITNEYTAPFNVTENCTIYAFAQKGEDKSATKSLEISLPFTLFADVLSADLSKKDEVIIMGNFEVLYQSAKYLMLTDGTNNLLVYGLTDTFDKGLKISKIEGTVEIFSNLLEIIDATITAGGNGATYEVKDMTSFEGLNYNDNLFDLYTFKGCTISGKSGKTAIVDLGEETILMYNTFGIDFENGENYDITAFVWRNNDNLQIVPTTIEGGEFIETVKTPVISPNKNELKEGDDVTITCATAGAVIYYTTDGTEPTKDSTKYEGEIDFTSDFTIKAIAYYEGDDKTMLPSEIAERSYHVFDPYCNILDNSHDTSNAGSYVRHTCTVDDVDYALVGMHDQERGLVLNKKQFSYIIQIGDNVGLALDKITVDFNTNSSNIELSVLASNTPFDDGIEDKAKPTEETINKIIANGVLIGKISATGSVSFEKDYNYFAIYPSNKNNAVYLNSIKINYREPKAVDETEIPSLDGFEMVNVDGILMTDDIPTHENWITKYAFNGGEEQEFDSADCYIEIDASDLDDATLHTLEIWYEHYYHGTASDKQTFNHLTNPNLTDASDEGMLKFNFGTIGEGVKIYFTINGKNPAVENASVPANVVRRAKSGNGTYTLDSEADKEATHSVSTSNTVVAIDPALLGDKYIVKAQAVHADTNTVSEIITKEGSTTSIVELGGTAGTNVIYDLMGRRVQPSSHGIYISNGVKVRL